MFLVVRNFWVTCYSKKSFFLTVLNWQNFLEFKKHFSLDALGTYIFLRVILFRNDSYNALTNFLHREFLDCFNTWINKFMQLHNRFYKCKNNKIRLSLKLMLNLGRKCHIPTTLAWMQQNGGNMPHMVNRQLWFIY